MRIHKQCLTLRQLGSRSPFARILVRFCSASRFSVLVDDDQFGVLQRNAADHAEIAVFIAKTFNLALDAFLLSDRFPVIEYFSDFARQQRRCERFLKEMSAGIKNAVVDDDVFRITGHIENFHLRIP